MALLVQDGAVVGRSFTDPVRYLTTGFTAPDPALPAPATRLVFTACLDVITTPLFDEVRERNPVALARLREIHRALRAQREDRHRADALLETIATFVEDYGR
ncbi:hypothetical protein [Streptomyces prasinus]|uniref:hypothetical protein n=1 Tax=Streptomyces prasinus TaxID=67345 RepID=UPI0006EBCB51|nr:hypothetical protein [Streptomyces prasinus]